MARAPVTPRKTTSTQAERTQKRLLRQQKALDKEMLADMNVKIAVNGGKMPKLGDLIKISPMTDTQEDFFSAWYDAPEDNIAFILNGVPGVGKTFLAMYVALEEILNPDSEFEKIIILRGTKQVSDLGFLKGDLTEKVSPFTLPYVQACSDLTRNKHAYEKLCETGKIEFMCTSFLRGLNFENAIVYVDEASSLTWHEINTICTRISKNTKLIISGSKTQNDLIYSRNEKSGYSEFLAVSNRMNEFRRFDFTSDDICRSGFTKSWVVACEALGID